MDEVWGGPQRRQVLIAAHTQSTQVGRKGQPERLVCETLGPLGATRQGASTVDTVILWDSTRVLWDIPPK